MTVILLVCRVWNKINVFTYNFILLGGDYRQKCPITILLRTEFLSMSIKVAILKTSCHLSCAGLWLM